MFQNETNGDRGDISVKKRRVPNDTFCAKQTRP